MLQPYPNCHSVSNTVFLYTAIAFAYNAHLLFFLLVQAFAEIPVAAVRKDNDDIHRFTCSSNFTRKFLRQFFCRGKSSAA